MDEESTGLSEEKCKDEVLSLSAEECLPVNLTDDLIHYLDNELDSMMLCGTAEEVNNKIPCALEVVVKIINAKNGGGSLFTAVLKELFDKASEYRTEIALEIFRRRTNINCEPATLENIFTNRNIGCWCVFR